MMQAGLISICLQHNIVVTSSTAGPGVHTKHKSVSTSGPYLLPCQCAHAWQPVEQQGTAAHEPQTGLSRFAAKQKGPQCDSSALHNNCI